MKVAVPIRENKRLSSGIAPTQKKTVAYLFAEIQGNKIRKVYVRKLKEKDREPLALGEFLKKEKINILIDNKLNSIMYFNLRRTHHILIYPRFSGVKTAKKALELLMIDT
jgi:predicted Fe-Mo cluster-binding NifX family protein